MRRLLQAAFWGVVAVPAWVYFGYPVVLAAMARRRPRPVRSGAVRPSVTVVVPAHDEAAVIAEKVENALAQEYPAELLEVLVASDGSTDATEPMVRALAEAHPGRVRLLALPRRGKAAALDAAARAARGELLAFSDANTLLAPGALARLVEPFADPEVGGVCGNKRIRRGRAADATAEGEGLYWRYDQAVKELESRVGSVFAADGSLYAVRRELYVPIADPAQADDIAISARVVLQGRRLVFAPGAVVWDEPPEEGREELRRKVRVTNHSVRALCNLGPALWRSGFYSLQLVSHKLLRHLVPLFLLPALLCSAVLAPASRLYRLLLGGQLAFYALACLGWRLRGTRAGRRRLLAVPYYFGLANLAALLGVLSIARGERRAAWIPRQGLRAEVDRR